MSRTTENLTNQTSDELHRLPDPTTPPMETRAVFRQFWALTRGDRRLMILATLLLICAAAADTIAILLFGYVVDHVLTENGGLHAFWRPAAAWAGVTTLSTIVSWGGSMLTTLVGERFVLRLRTKLHSQLAAAAPDFLDSARLGDLLTRFSEDLEEVESLVVGAVIAGFTAAASVVMFSVSAIRLSPTLALLSLVLAPLLWAVTGGFSRRVGAVTRAERINHSRMMSVLEETLANTALTRSSGRGSDEAARLATEGRSFLKLNLRQARLTGAYAACTGLLEMFAVIGVLGVGAWQISHGKATVGALLAFSAYLGYLYPPLHSLAGLPLMAAGAQASAARVEELLVTAEPVPDTGTLIPAGPGRLVFEGVTFAYRGRTRPVLDNFALAVEPGELVALTGPSGAGKSTVGKLTARDLDPTAGRITLDSHDLREYGLDALRASITVLAQETLLFDATLADNIGYARHGSTRAEVESAAASAGLSDLVASLPEGLDTRVGQRGRLLSGGQRQRIAIARAFLRDAPLLILDEPTTGLDHDGTSELLPALRRLAAGRTTLMVTHDLQLTCLADRVVCLDSTLRPAAADADLALPAAVVPRADRTPRVPEPVPSGFTRVLPRSRRVASLVGVGSLVLVGVASLTAMRHSPMPAAPTVAPPTSIAPPAVAATKTPTAAPKATPTATPSPTHRSTSTASRTVARTAAEIGP